MAIEKKWESIPSITFSADGTSAGLITIPSTSGFKVKQEVFVRASGEPNLALQVKRVIGPTQLIVGPRKASLSAVEDISAYTVAKGASIDAPEQERPAIPDKEYERAAFEEEPVVAKRTILVDPGGRFFSAGNPIPVRLSDGSVNIGTVNAELEVQLSHLDGDPDSGDVHDSVRIGDGVRQAGVTSNSELKTNDIEANTKLLFTLLANSNFMKLINFDQVVPSISGDTTTLSYYVTGDLVGEVRLRFVSSLDWDLALEAYINNDGAGLLLDDDDTRLILD